MREMQEMRGTRKIGELREMRETADPTRDEARERTPNLKSFIPMERTYSLYMLFTRGVASNPLAGTGAVSTKGTKPSLMGISSLHSFSF